METKKTADQWLIWSMETDAKKLKMMETVQTLANEYSFDRTQQDKKHWSNKSSGQVCFHAKYIGRS